MAASSALLAPAALAGRAFAGCSNKSMPSKAYFTGTTTLAAVKRPRHSAHSQRQQLTQRTLICRAESNDEDTKQQSGEQSGASPASSSNSPTPAPPPKRAEDPSIAKGQRTAIITGAISIIFGVIYLALVSFLDMRGGEMLPPPPEAFGP